MDRLPRVNLAKAGAQLEVVLSRPEAVTWWRAAYTDSIDERPAGIELGSWGDPEASTSESETASFAFAGPPAGSWFLIVDLTFAPWGDATYSWHAVVGD